MIAWLKGSVIEADGNEIVIDTNGVGYRVLVGSNIMIQTAAAPGDEIELAIYTSVKDDGISLFGFQDFFSRKIFVLLLQVNGVGPKVAMSIIDQLGAADIVRSLRAGDTGIFTRVSGVGKKTAQRIILDLQGKMELLQFECIAETAVSDDDDRVGKQKVQEQIRADAVSALSNLGFSAREAEKTIARHISDENSFDELIRKCLADMKKNL